MMLKVAIDYCLSSNTLWQHFLFSKDINGYFNMYRKGVHLSNTLYYLFNLLIKSHSPQSLKQIHTKRLLFYTHLPI